MALRVESVSGTQSVHAPDVTGLNGFAAWSENLQGRIDTLKINVDARYITLTGLPPMHLFPALPQPLRLWLEARARKLNAMMVDVAQSNERCVLVEAPLPVDAESMAEDGFHPGNSACSLWADMLAGLILKALRSPQCYESLVILLL